VPAPVLDCPIVCTALVFVHFHRQEIWICLTVWLVLLVCVRAAVCVVPPVCVWVADWVVVSDWSAVCVWLVSVQKAMQPIWSCHSFCVVVADCVPASACVVPSVWVWTSDWLVVAVCTPSCTSVPPTQLKRQEETWTWRRVWLVLAVWVALVAVVSDWLVVLVWTSVCVPLALRAVELPARSFFVRLSPVAAFEPAAGFASAVALPPATTARAVAAIATG
jgi:hypothetical protein